MSTRFYALVPIFLLMLAACSGAASTPAPTAAPQLAGAVTLDYPQSGTTVYAEALFASGTASGLPDDRFTLQIVDLEEDIIAQSTVLTGGADDWQVEIPHSYSGEPVEALVQAVPEDAQGADVYAVAIIVLAGLDYRPEGLAGRIITPLEGDTVGGDIIPVSGTGSGLTPNMFFLRLVAPDDEIIDETLVGLVNPYFIDDVPWNAELATNGYRGPARIIAIAESTMDADDSVLVGEVQVLVSEAAG